MSDIRDESDDLVTRLRAWRDFEYVEGEVPHDLITRAIDEIERLNEAFEYGCAEIERLRDLIRTHNASCENACAARSDAHCPDCPRKWMIDIERGGPQR